MLELEAGHADPERLHAIFRAAHSVKGAAGTFGWTAIVRITHAMEDLLDRMRSDRLAVEPSLVNLLLSGVDELKCLMSRRDGGDDFANKLSPATNTLVARMKALVVSPGSEVQQQEPVHNSSDAEHQHHVRFLPSRQCFQKGIDPLLALRELSDFGMLNVGELDVDRLPSLEQLDPMVCYIGWHLKLTTELNESEVRTALLLVDGDAEVSHIDPLASIATDSLMLAGPGNDAAEGISAPPGQQRVGGDRRTEPAQSIRVSAQKVDHLIDLAGELVITYSMANEILMNFTPDCMTRLREALAAMERATRELQERVMSIRMMPASSVFQRFPRLVYDTAAKTGKQIAIHISGEDTELDKTVAEQLLDPLTHLVRNSADHGVESPEHRRRAGKPEQGLITLRAFHQSGKVVIEVTDDGQGLDVEKIRRKAVSKGLIGRDVPLTEAAAHQLIFAPGFSTKDEVTDLSGRGVGMDVVKRNVEALNGSIRIESVPGKGTSVRLHLPLTLAIVDGLLLRVGEQSFALPFAAVVESVRPTPSQLLRITGGLPGNTNAALVLRSETMPLLSLGRLFNIPGALTDPTRGLVVLVDTGTRKMALLVDDIVGHQQFVIKSLEKNFRRVEGALGATILGDGRVALIIDVSALWEMNLAGGTGLLAA